MATYYGLTTQNAQMLGRHIVAMGRDKEAVRREAEIERANGPLVRTIGANIFTDTELKNLVVVSETIARRRFGITDYRLDEFLGQEA